MNEKLFNPDYLLHLCQKYNLSPSKKYGQNYLINPEVIERIVEAGDIKNSDTIVEVGPGFGVLTLSLAEQANKVIAFEIEKKLQPYWEEEMQKNTNIKVVWGNVLKEAGVILNGVERNEESSRIQGDPSLTLRMTGGYKLIANLPYQITSPILRTFLEAEKQPYLMVLMVQKEVAERICAKPGDMSLLAVSVQYYAEAEYLFTVPRTDFWPSPAVDSAVIKLKVKSEKLKDIDGDFLFNVVRAGFAQKRKLLIKNLEPLGGKGSRERLGRIFEDLGLAPTARAQELSVEQWVELAGKLKMKE